jgi:hypothetical protein
MIFAPFQLRPRTAGAIEPLGRPLIGTAYMSPFELEEAVKRKLRSGPGS